MKKIKEWNWTPVVELLIDGVKLTALLDSGASHSLIATNKIKVAVNKTKPRKVKNIWSTCGSSNYTTSTKSIIEFQLPEFTTTRKVKWEFFHTTSSKTLNGYDCIIGRDLLKELKINIRFEEGIIQWDHVKVPMKDYEHVRSVLAGEVNTLYTDLPESDHIKDMNQRTNRILDANYEKADIDAYMQEYNKLNEKERLSLRSLLKKYENLFDGTLGKWKRKPVSLNIKPNAKLVQR